MLSGLGPVSIRLDAQSGLTLRSGDVVSVNVLARAHGNKWAVGIQGRVVSAFTQLELAPGARLLARVERQGGRLLLRVLEHPSPALRELAVRAGLAPDAATERLLSAFLASGIRIHSETVQQARRLLDRLNLEPRRFARLIAQLLEKKLDLGSTAVENLLPLLGFGEGGEERERRYQPKPFSRQVEGMEAELRRGLLESGPEGKENPLSLFNHLSGLQEHWIIIPFRYRDEGGVMLSGTVRLRYDQGQGSADRLVLAVSAPAGERWSFVLSRLPEAKGYMLHQFRGGDGPVRGKTRAWRELAQKLQNLGVKTDDTIRVDEGFDGFSLPWESNPYRGVDTEG